MKKNTSVSASTFDVVDETFVKNVNEVMDTICDHAGQIGKLTQDYVDAKGGGRYGDKIISHIASHPNNRCAKKTIYRYWGYYRLINRYGNELKKDYPELTASHLYELARLLEAPDHSGHKSSADAHKKLVFKVAALKRDGKNPVSVTVMREEVTRVLDQECTRANVPLRSRKRGRKMGHANGNHGAETAVHGEGLDHAVQCIEKFAVTNRKEKGDLTVAALTKEIERLANAVCAIVENIVGRGEGAAVAPLITDLQKRLNSLHVRAKITGSRKAA